MHGIILTGGVGSRCRPHTYFQNKHLLSVNSKFIVDYPLSCLKSMGVTELTVLLGGEHFDQIINYIKNGENFGFNSVNYVFQAAPSGIAQAINLCQHTVKDDFIVILGDNIFENSPVWQKSNKAQIMLARHPSLTRFGVASLTGDKIIKIEEKPQILDSRFINLAISGCYKFTPKFFEYFKDLKPSARDEFEITDIINKYLADDDLSYSFVEGLWSDAGTHESINYLNYYFYQKDHGIHQK